MLRSLSAAVSGLRNQQTRMDVIGNNIANVNTVAFKSGRVTFKEGYAQIIESAARPDTGGLNPMQVGLGSQIGSVDTLFTQGNLESTGNNTDLAIQGPSFFVVRQGSQSLYTRAGNFQVDSKGTLVAGGNGFALQGRMSVGGKLSDAITDVTIPVGEQAAAVATTSISLTGDLDAAATPFDKGTATTLDPLDATQRALPQNAHAYKDLSITAYDSLGAKQEVKLVIWKTGTNTWDWKADGTGMDITKAGITEVQGTHPITFNSDGSVDTTGFTPPEITFTPNSGAAAVDITLDVGTGLSGLSQLAGSNNAVMRSQNGNASGNLQNFTIDSSGAVVGSFTNGMTQVLGQLVLADFNNPAGLVRTGDDMYNTSANSGSPVLGYSGEGTTSSIASGNLEMSNVDLAQEFTDMIVAQRGFQANGKVITASDQMLQDLVNLKQ